MSISYDDALPCHYEVVARGHELGNHTIFHPCRKRGESSWLADEYDLRAYTPRRWSDEMRVAARGPFNGQVVDVSTINFNALGHFGGDDRDFERLRQELDTAVGAGGSIVYMIHGVGEGTHGMYIDPEVHQRLVDNLGERQDAIWTAPVATVARYLRDCA